MQKTYEDVIKETVEFYSKNDRAVDGFTCMYLSAEGNMCAVGRCLKPDVLEKVNDFKGDSESLVTDFTKDGDITELLQEEYSSLNNKEFWGDLQFLHDSADYWKDKKLTERGKLKVEVLLEKYSN